MIKTGLIDAQLAIDIVRSDKREIAYDTETSGLKFSDYVVGYVITSWELSVYVPVRHEGGGNIPNVDEFEEELASAFRDRGRKGYRTIGHNLGFDLRMSGKVGYGGKKTAVLLMSPLEDTMINEALINDRTLGYGLDDCSVRHGVTVKKGDELYRAIAARFGGLPDRKSMQHFYKMPGDDPVVVDYATGDGVSTIELWKAQQVLLDEEEVRKPWKLECDLLPYLARMYLRGIKVDPEYSSKVMTNIAERIAEAKELFTPGFNVRSAKEIEALYRANGYTDSDFDRTDKGAISFTEKFLSKNEIGQSLVAVRQLEKAKDSFILPLIETHNSNGRVHPSLNQSKTDENGVAGARFSCSDPNLQAFPKRNEAIGKTVRPLVVPDFGHIYEMDFQQQEPRFFTHYSEEPALIEGYNNGTMDIHDRASEVLGLERKIAKRLGMGMLTMMYPKTLAGHMGCSVDQARIWHRQFLTDAFPLIAKFQADAVATFEARGFVRSILGRKARMESRRFSYQAVSRIIQNSGGDHMKTALLRACQYEDAYPDEFQVLLTIHDSTMFQTEPGSKHPSEMKRILENVVREPDFNLLVPIPVETGHGLNWGDASYAEIDDVV